jgi:hypothetical protein
VIAIDKNVPIPAATRGPAPVFPWRRMEVGDSFFVPDRANTNSLSCNAAALRKRYGLKFTVRRENGGVRVWRIA